MSNLKVRFQNKEYVLSGTLENGGPIATPEQMRTFSPSFAHLFSSGKIMRHGGQIGTRDDLEVIGTDDTEVGFSFEGFSKFFEDRDE